jgi:hypothetical protein
VTKRILKLAQRSPREARERQPAQPLRHLDRSTQDIDIAVSDDIEGGAVIAGRFDVVARLSQQGCRFVTE